MYCKKVKVQNFRNIESADISFCDRVNILIGENAQGKTNLLEAIFLSSVGRSFRAGASAQMIRFGKEQSKVEIEYLDSIRDNKLSVTIFKDKKKLVEKNGFKIDKLSDVVGSFRAVLFCPEHLSLIKDGPSERRAYLDMAISRLYPMYIHSLQRYSYFLKERNALIKNAFSDRATFDSTVDIWSEKLAEEAAIITDFRYEYVKRAESFVCDCFFEMMGDSERPSIAYESSSGIEFGEDGKVDRVAVKNKYIGLLSGSHEREIAAGATLWGIHKDDIDIKLNGKSARIYASQGQQRSLALALKLAEGEICRSEFGDHPVFLFDDVLSELDSTRRDYLINKMKNKQVIITSCDRVDRIDASGESEIKLIEVSDGKYREL